MRRHRGKRIAAALLMVAGAGLLLAFIQPGGNGDRWASLTKRAGEYLRPPV